MKRNRGIAAITGKNVIGLKSHNVINRKLTLWVKNYIISEHHQVHDGVLKYFLAIEVGELIYNLCGN